MTIRAQRHELTPDRCVRRGRAAVVGSVGALGAAALAYVAAVDPHDRAAVLPRCPIHWATGLDCPGCGGLRMTHDLLHGDIARALADNAVLLMLAPILLALLAVSVLRWVRGGPATLDARLTAPLLAVGLAWFAVRNIAGW